MGFLDRINANQQATGTEGAGAKPNPLAAKKPNPLAAKKPNPLLGARKPSIPLRPAKEQQVETTEEVVTETTEEVIVEQVEEVVTETTEDTKAPEDAPAVETETVENVVEEVSTPDEADATAKPASAPKAKKNTSQRTQKAKSAVDQVETVEMPTTTMDYAEAVEAIRSPFKDEKWDAFKEEIKNDLSSIQITEDMNPGVLKVVTAELSILRDKIFYALYEAKTEYDRYTSKEPEGLIERVKRINSVGGNNDTERRRNGIMACMSYETATGPINLYELMDEARSRYMFLRMIDESIKFKKDLLITMNGSLKLEKELM